MIYSNDNQCWTITAPYDQVVEIDVEHMDLEQSYNCNSDYVKIHDGNYYDSLSFRYKFLVCSFRQSTNESKTSLFLQVLLFHIFLQ